MKKKMFLVLLSAIAGVIIFAACAGAPRAQPPVTGTAAAAGDGAFAPAEYITVDWQGRNTGAQIPAWVQYASMQDPENQLAELPRLKGKKPIIAQQQGANLQIVQSSLNTGAYADCALKIRTAVEVRAQGAADGALDKAAATTVVNQFNTLYAKATLTGLGKELESWIKVRSTKDGSERYEVYAIYAISDEDLRASINETLGKLSAGTQAEQELKNKLQDQMDDLVRSAKF